MIDQSKAAEYVDGRELSLILGKWIDMYLIERPVHLKKNSPFIGPIDLIAHKTGINQRTIRSLITVDTELVTLSMADRILTPLGLYVDTDIEVIKNPKWSQEKWFDYMKGKGCIYDE